ncbi:DUF262 domain-containing protein [Gloeobacter violaceus]|nr:DUF262 domain-containing protein [Gloeobacter violaceus]
MEAILFEVPESVINIEEANQDTIEDIAPEDQDLSELIVYSRDWTVETIVSQIQKGNIDLNPKFQRRNAWSDDRRSKLIESLIVGIPVPEIVFAEDKELKKSFIVIDGKQRLLTIAGFFEPDKFNYWNDPKLKNLLLRKDLNSVTYAQLKSRASLSEDYRRFLNADIRCTVISNYASDDILYDIFYRLNTGSSPLATQELRQVLKKGAFADYLIEITNSYQLLHEVLRLRGSDPRLQDVEILLRFFCISLFPHQYKGNLKKFLDDSMAAITKNWSQCKPKVDKLYGDFNIALARLSEILTVQHIGRKFTGDKWEARFNKALFEVEIYYFCRLSDAHATIENNERFLEKFKQLCGNNPVFRSSIESTTKSLDKYETRYSLFQELVNDAYNCEIDDVPVRNR